MLMPDMRKAAGFKTQKEIAEKLGVSRTAIVKWESGFAFPRSSKISILAELYGVTSDEILRACDQARTQRLNSA